VKFQVILLPRAEQQLCEAALWWSEHRNLDQALRWLEGFESAIQSLTENPARVGFARENDAFPFGLRQLNYGLGKHPTHRAVFEIHEDSTVLVHAIRHLAQDEISPDEIQPS